MFIRFCLERIPRALGANSYFLSPAIIIQDQSFPSMSLPDFINSAVQQSTKWQKSPMEQSLLLLSTSKTFTKIRNKHFVKVVMGSVALVVAIVIWDEYPNIKLRIAPERHGLFGKVPFCVGVMLILYSFWFSIIGIWILANSLFKLPMLIQLGTAASLQGYKDKDYEEKRRKTKIIPRMLCTMIMMVTLLCATCSGINLVISPIKENGLYALTVSIGVATVAFGLIYFIIGAVIMVELAGGLVSFSQTKCENESKEGDISQRSGPEAMTIV